MLVERIGVDLDLDPFAAAGDDRKYGIAGGRDPHVVLKLGHVLLGSGFLREGPRQHGLGLEHRTDLFDHAVQRGRHPFVHGMADTPLNVLDRLARTSLVPGTVQHLGHGAELDNQIIGEIFRLDLAALFPEASANFAMTYPKAKIRYRESEAAFDQASAAALGIPVDRIDFGDGQTGDQKSATGRSPTPRAVRRWSNIAD